MNTGAHRLSLNAMYTDSETVRGVPLGIHTAVIIVVLLEGALGNLFGLELSSLMLWVPVNIIIAYSLLIVSKQPEIITPVKKFTPVVITIYLMVLWRFTAIFWTISDRLSFKESIKTFYLLLFIMTTQYVISRTTRERLLRMIALVVTIALVASVLAYLYRLGYAGFSYYGEKAFKKRIGIFYRGNMGGAVIMLLGLWNWCLVFSGAKYRKIGFINLGLTLFLLFGIASQAALGGYLISISVVLLYYFYLIRDRMLLFYLSNLSAIGLACFSVYYVVKSTTIWSLTTLNGRLGIWIEAINVLREGQWLTGVGSGAAQGLTSATSVGTSNLHNVLIYSLASGGIVELGMVLFIFIWLMKLALSQKQGRGIVLMAFIAGVFVRNLAEASGLLFGYMNNSWVYLSWYVLISIIVLLTNSSDHTGESGNEINPLVS